METKKLTAAESTLAAMSKTVLVLGIIGSIVVFFSSCIAWEYSRYSGGIVGVDGINWLGFPALIYCIMGTLIGWSALAILVEIAINTRTNNSQSNWKKDFAVMVAAGEKGKAKEILYRGIMESEEFKQVLTGGNENYHKECIDALNKKYSNHLKAIGEDTFVNTDENNIYKVFK